MPEANEPATLSAGMKGTKSEVLARARRSELVRNGAAANRADVLGARAAIGEVLSCARVNRLCETGSAWATVERRWLPACRGPAAVCATLTATR
jgi:hypothetical protein